MSPNKVPKDVPSTQQNSGAHNHSNQTWIYTLENERMSPKKGTN